MRAGPLHIALAAGSELEQAVGERLRRLDEIEFSRRLGEHDPTLWFQEPTPEITDRLGWLELPERMASKSAELQEFAREVRGSGVREAFLFGMGGSSLAPDVFAHAFSAAAGLPLTVLDTTHPDAVRAALERIDPARTFFVVSSKSGTTLETLSLFRTFYAAVKRGLEAVEDAPAPGSFFAAVTDPSTPLVSLGEEHGFRRVFRADADLGGRYSALSHFGLVPAALLGVDIPRLLARAGEAASDSGPGIEAASNPGLLLGAVLGEAARHGRDKVTFFAEPEIELLPDWLEQLIAESTGKKGKGIVPVAHEAPTSVEHYGDDRLFVGLSLAGGAASKTSALSDSLDSLAAAGHPVVRCSLRDLYDLGYQMFTWEVAVAVAGAVIGIHPFNQPDVQLAKDLAKKAMKGEGLSEKDLPAPISASDEAALAEALEGWLNGGSPGGYQTIQAYLAPSDELSTQLHGLQARLRDLDRRATTDGYGPRFLHSTGQLHKGGPNIGRFLQLVDQPHGEVEVPGQGYGFGQIIKAQAEGDRQALLGRDRAVLAVDLGADAQEGLEVIGRLLPSVVTPGR
ncbi:MAG TPA: hypothetical protein VKA53_06790 [Thermoanaerobaculia bacterium]|nr:hypothetical protein [Thermoanaerobaculia bacterium]